ncbi:hypothetical protein GBSOP10_110910 [Armatimonadetes bacterium GBS]|jgi:hypothetical protein|nr:hypothetical protein GBSOP10_110910 [Armatimonadetes bacterium GBS]CUU34489.1 hypothetical protein GXSOP10_11660 [Armatimonadetes bacterium GXS]
MKTDIDPKIAWSVIAALLIIVAAAYYIAFRGPAVETEPGQIGMGKPVKPGEISPDIPPPPWTNESSTSLQPQSPQAETR